MTALEDDRPTVYAAREIHVHYTARGTVDVPAGTPLTLLGYGARSGFPVVASVELGLAGAHVEPDAIVGNVREPS